MASCINKSSNDYKALVNTYGDVLADNLVYSYNKRVLNKDILVDEIDTPTVKEINSYIQANKKDQYLMIERALELNPFMSIDAITTMLKGVVNKYNEGYFINKHSTETTDNTGFNDASLELYKTNIEIVKGLSEKFPSVFRIIQYPNTYRVEITNAQERIPNSSGLVNEAEDIIFDALQDKKKASIENANALTKLVAEKLKNNLNVDYSIISTEEAFALLKDTVTPYNNQGAFFFNNKVYFVEGNLTMESVLHEFSHPLIKGIMNNNMTLFKSLYSSVPEEIKSYVKQQRPDLSEERLMEETIVVALTEESLDLINKKLKNSPEYNNFLRKLVYAIKKIFRILSKKVDLKDMSLNTTLKDISKMLVDEDFNIVNKNYATVNFAEFKTEIESITEEFEKAGQDTLIEAINRTYEEATYQLNSLKATPWKLKKELIGENGSKILKYVRDELSKYQDIDFNNPESADVNNVIEALKDQQKNFRLRTIALVKSINDIEIFVENIEKNLADLSRSENLTLADAEKIKYFSQFLNEQVNFIEDLRKITEFSKNSQFWKKLNSISDSISNAKRKISKIEFDLVKDLVETNTEVLSQAVEDKFLNEDVRRILTKAKISEPEIQTFIDNIKASPLKQYSTTDIPFTIDNYYKKIILKKIKEYSEKRINSETIENYLQGKMPELGFFSATITPYANIDDPIVSATVRMLREAFTKSQSKSLKQYNEIGSKLLPKLKAVGWNKNSTGQLGEMMLEVDTVGSYEDGVLKPFKIYTFMNTHINWRYDKSVLEDNLDKAITSKNKDEIKKAYQELKTFEEKYMHREFVKEYYDAQKIYTDSVEVINPETNSKITVSKELAFEANLERLEALNELRTLTSKEFMNDDYDSQSKESDYAKAKYDKLFDLYAEDGTLKKGDELLKTLVRKKHRALTRKFYEYVPDNSRIQQDLNNYVLKLEAKGITMEETPEEFNKELEKFIINNFETSYTDDYFKDRNRIFETLQKLGSKNPQASELSELYKRRAMLANKFLDNSKQPNGTQLSPSEKEQLLNLELEIIKKQELFNISTGLTKAESDRLDFLNDLIINDKADTSHKQEYYTLNAKSKANGLTESEFEVYKKALKDYANLKETNATSYYIDTVNSILEPLSGKIPTFNQSNINGLLTDAQMREELFQESPEFKAWFEKNHYSRNFGLNKKGEEIIKFYRLASWNVTRPSNPDHYKSTVLEHPLLKKSLSIPGVPKGKYTTTRIKKEYRTGYDPTKGKVNLIVGLHVDNKGNYLPKDYEPGNPDSAFDDKYINKKYKALKASNSNEYKLLEATKKEYLAIQENAYKSGKLYLDLARFRQRNNLEYLQSGKGKDDLIDKSKSIVSGIKSTFTKAVDDAENSFNYDVSSRLVTTDISGERIDRIPVRGIYKLQLEETSTDVLRSMYEYMYSLNDHEELAKIEPLTNALSNVLSNPENATKNMQEISKNLKKGRNITKFLTSKSNPRRQEAIDHYIEKAMYGRPNSEFIEDYPGFVKVAQTLMGAASRSFIMLDFSSALKNRYGMLFQSMLEASGSKYITPVSLTKGRVRSFKNMVQLTSSGIYSLGPKSLDVQIMENFDPITGKTKTDFGKSSSRSFLKDAIDMTWLYDHRRFMEVEASLQIFWAMMYNKDIEQTLPSGEVVKIKYADAFELDADKNLKLKEGINPEYFNSPIEHTLTVSDTYESLSKKYNTTVENLEKYNGKFEDLKEGETLKISDSKLFFDFKMKIQGVGKKLNGQMDELDNPQANKYLLYRLFTFYRKFATGMFLNRFQNDRSKTNKGGYVYDTELGDVTRGFYITGFKAILENIKTLGKYYNLMSKEEKQAVIKMTTEGMFVMILALAVGLIFGYDPDDEDRFKKLREKQKDSMAGYISNHLLYQILAIRSENQTFIPYLGFKEWINFTDKTTIATGPTLGLYSKILMDLFYLTTGDERAYYKQDVGPYSWQEEGRSKIYNHLASIFGFTGKNYDPVWAIKKFETFKNLS